MEKKIELQVLNITNSQAQIGAYALLLGEVDGERRLPIIIGPAEAQSTALSLKGIKTPRPLTHELFNTCIHILGAFLARVLIYKAVEGVFYSYIYLQKEDEIIRVDARTSDAIALAVRSDCPIYIYDSILERECLRLPATDSESTEKTPSDDYSSATMASLEQELEKAVKDENYELAARIRDEIKQRKQ